MMWCGKIFFAGLFWFVWAFTAQGEAVTLVGENAFLQNREGLIVMENGGVTTAVTRTGSLFAGAQAGGLFAPYPARVTMGGPRAGPLSYPMGGNDVDQLRHLISQAESRLHGYDAVQHGARIRPTKLPTQMTLGEIYAWIEATPGQPHAIGRYQFIPTTLRMVAARAGAEEAAVFSPVLQDRLADELLADAGFAAFRRGDMGRHRFMNNLARIWAGLPNDTGQSHYDGYAGNKAAISWEDFDAAMIAIFEDS